MLKSRGFTLVELIIVIAIISILVTMVIIAIDPIRVINDSRDTKKRSELNQVKTSLQLYFNENNRYPDPSEMGTGGSVPFVDTYMRQLPAEWATNYSYGSSGADYDAAVTLANPDTSDEASEANCTADGANGVGGDFWVCPD